MLVRTNSILIVVTALYFPLVALSDSSSEAQNAPETTQRSVESRSILPELDPRMPPVIPGQEVKVGERKMRVWSSSGSVSVSPPPESPTAPSPPNQQSLPIGPVGVIIDDRHDQRR